MVLRYATHDYDSVLEIYYAKARIYDPTYKRFLAVDPILDPSKYDVSNYSKEPMMFNQYIYVMDNPIKYVDPLGMFYILNVINKEYKHIAWGK